MGRFDVKRIDEKDKLIQSLKVKLKKEKLEKRKAAFEAKKNYKKLQEMKKNIKDQKFNVIVKWKWKNDSNEWKECSDGLSKYIEQCPINSPRNYEINGNK